MAPGRVLSTLAPFRVARPDASVRLLCFPFAGGAATVYRSWPAALAPHIDVCPIELPGRGVRFAEPCVSDLPQLTRDLVQGLAPLFDLPIALFGHSMGSHLALEVARRADAEIRHVFASGSPAPHLESRADGRFGLMTDAELIAQIRAWGGTPKEILDNAELMQLALPILRSDLALLEGHPLGPEPPLACPLTVISGTDDAEAPPSAASAWSVYTRSVFRAVAAPGGHFFLNDAAGRRTIFDAIEASLVP